MKKVFSVVGARPNFMKVAPIHRALLTFDSHIEHTIVHTGQHYDAIMSDAFFDDLDMPKPGYFLSVGSASHAVQTSKIMTAFETICMENRPDRHRCRRCQFHSSLCPHRSKTGHNGRTC